MKLLYITLILNLFFSLNIYAKTIATITALKGDADIQRKDTLLIALLGSKLEEQDKIITKESAKLQIIFKDETIISIGQNSEFSIEEYLFENNTPPVAKFGMLRGAMRTITGQIGDLAPDRFSVATKTATIGIRGTNFSLFVENDGSSSAFCTFGAISVSIAGVSHVVNQGFYINVTPQGQIEIKEFTPAKLENTRSKHFTKNQATSTKPSVAKTEQAQSTSENNINNFFASENTAQIDTTRIDIPVITIDNIKEISQTSIQDIQTTLDTKKVEDIKVAAAEEAARLAAEEAARLAAEEAARLAAEEAARLAAEEAARLAAEEAARLAAEEAARLATEEAARLAAEEAARLAAEEAARITALETAIAQAAAAAAAAAQQEQSQSITGELNPG